MDRDKKANGWPPIERQILVGRLLKLQVFVLVNFVVAIVGCGGASSQPESSGQPRSAKDGFDATAPSAALPPSAKIKQTQSQATISQKTSSPSTTEKPAPATRSLADLVPSGIEPNLPPPILALPEIDDATVRALGIRKLSGQHLVLYTDLPVSPAVDELPHVFDMAVPKWCEYFAIPLQQAANWRVAAYVIQDKDRFHRAGLIPNDLPEFLNGYHRGAELWLYEQPSEYYRRHLLLHEGTHAFMMWSLQGAGPPWYMEGTAELFATHLWNNGQLTLRYFPADRHEVPEWGRIRIIKDDIRANRGKTLMDVLHYDSRAHLRVEPYGWCWAAASFLDNHPRYQKRFRDLHAYAQDTEDTFSERFLGWFREDGQRLWREWQWFIVNIDYGYDIAREAIQFEPSNALGTAGMTVDVATDRGWQSTGIRFEAGREYRIEAEGRYQLKNQPMIWWSEPNGVTIRYHRGHPLGMVLGTVVDESDPEATDNGFLTPTPIGPAAEMNPALSGTFFLRINDAPSELSDNQGIVKVRITSAAN